MVHQTRAPSFLFIPVPLSNIITFFTKSFGNPRCPETWLLLGLSTLCWKRHFIYTKLMTWDIRRSFLGVSDTHRRLQTQISLQGLPQSYVQCPFTPHCHRLPCVLRRSSDPWLPCSKGLQTELICVVVTPPKPIGSSQVQWEMHPQAR